MYHLPLLNRVRLRIISDLHRTKETRNQVLWEAVVLQILFGSKADITTAHKRVEYLHSSARATVAKSALP